MLRRLKRLFGDGFEHQLPGLEAKLPDAVAGRPLAKWSLRGADYFAGTALSKDEIAEVASDLATHGLGINDVGMAVAGRSDVAIDPPYFVHAFCFRTVPADTLHPGVGVQHPDAGSWTPVTFGRRDVSVGTEEMVDQTEHMAGRPYVYNVGDVRFVVTAGDESWAADAIAHLRPDPLVEQLPNLVALPPGWRAGLQPDAADVATASVRDDPSCLGVAHDSTRVGQAYVPHLRIGSRGVPEPGDDFATWLDDVEAVFRQAMADPATRDAVPSIERVRIPAGEAIRVELSSRPEPDTPYEVAQVQYYIPTKVGFFAIWFSAAASDLAAYRTTFDAMARTFLHADLYAEDYLDRFLLAVTK
jgi:hypothetical protein